MGLATRQRLGTSPITLPGLDVPVSVTDDALGPVHGDVVAQLRPGPGNTAASVSAGVGPGSGAGWLNSIQVSMRARRSPWSRKPSCISLRRSPNPQLNLSASLISSHGNADQRKPIRLIWPDNPFGRG